MENHTPQKRHQAIVSFSKDHHFGLLLIWKIRQGLNKAVNPERISNYVTFFFKEDLEKHFKEEEQLLFSKLPINDVLRKQAEGDHRAIYKLVAAIEKKKDDVVMLNQLADELEKHIRFEERVLFNEIQKVASPDNMEVTQKLHSSEKFIENTTDVFWE